VNGFAIEPLAECAGNMRAAQPATVTRGGQSDLIAPPELDFALNPANFVVQAFHFAREFIDGLNEALNDIVMRALLLRLAKKGFCPG
jgi:hypothetical protein